MSVAIWQSEQKTGQQTVLQFVCYMTEMPQGSVFTLSVQLTNKQPNESGRSAVWSQIDYCRTIIWWIKPTDQLEGGMFEYFMSTI